MLRLLVCEGVDDASYFLSIARRLFGFTKVNWTRLRDLSAGLLAGVEGCCGATRNEDVLVCQGTNGKPEAWKVFEIRMKEQVHDPRVSDLGIAVDLNGDPPESQEQQLEETISNHISPSCTPRKIGPAEYEIQLLEPKATLRCHLCVVQGPAFPGFPRHQLLEGLVSAIVAHVHPSLPPPALAYLESLRAIGFEVDLKSFVRAGMAIKDLRTVDQFYDVLISKCDPGFLRDLHRGAGMLDFLDSFLS